MPRQLFEMLIDTQTLEHGPKNFDVVIPRIEIDLAGEVDELTEGVSLLGRTKVVGGRTEIEAKLETKVKVSCSRCLELVTMPIKVDFDAKFVGAETFNAAAEHELDADALTVDVLEGECVDLAAIAREQILLNLPEQVFCKKDCRGLCEKCGANRNLIDCNCIDEEIDPRWAALKNLN